MLAAGWKKATKIIAHKVIDCRIAHRHLVLIALFAFALRGAPNGLAETPAHELVTNPAFAESLQSWQVSGDFHTFADNLHTDVRHLRMGPGAGTLAQRIQVGSRNHLLLTAVFDRALPSSCSLALRFLDRSGKEWMRLESGTDIQQGKDGKMGLYFRPHPRTEQLELLLTKTADGQELVLDRLSLMAYEDSGASVAASEFGSEQDSDLMQLLWQGSRVTQEAVALLAGPGEAAAGTLLLRPTRVVSVTSYDGRTTYLEGIDFKVVGRTLVALAGSRMQTIETAKLHQGELAWNEVGGRQVLVTYEHQDRWIGPVPPFVGSELPNTLRKLAAHEPVEMVAFGDSITFGVGSSQMQKLLPGRPPWVELFRKQLSLVSGDAQITVENAAQSGADSNWARKMAGRMVGTLHPDLVIVAFGQNDFWNLSPEEFAANIKALMEAVRATTPHVEFLLVSTMRFDPAYTSRTQYWDRETQYAERLRALTADGVQMVDMTAISSALYAAKEPKALLNDPLHPNDYLSRWYAQSLVAALHCAAAQEPPAAQ